MSKSYGSPIVRDGLAFYFNGNYYNKYNNGDDYYEPIEKSYLDKQNVTYDATGFFFNNSKGSSSSSSKILGSVGTNFANTTGVSAFVSFYNTSYLNEGVPSHYRQVPFSAGNDATQGGWGFERLTQDSSFRLRYHFDQEGAFGATLGFLGGNPLNDWTQIGFVNDGNTLKLYQNGVFNRSLDISSKTLGGTTNAYICVGAATSFYGFIGYIDNAVFYHKALSEQEVESNYQILKRD